MHAESFKTLRGVMAATTLAAVAACFYLTFIDFGPWLARSRSFQVYISLAVLLLATIVAGLQRRPIATAVHAGLFGVCFLLLGGMAAKGIGQKDVTLRLHATTTSAGSKVPRVCWSTLRSGRSWEDSPWDLVQTVGDDGEYRTTCSVDIISSWGYFEHTCRWRFFNTPGLIVVAAEGKRFRFEPETLFGRGQGLSDELTAFIDIDEYVSGSKQPPPVDWPPDNVALSAPESTD